MGSIRPRSLSEYAQMLWRKKLLFLSITGAILIAALIIISQLPDLYESRAAIVVTGKQDERQALADRVAAVRERLSSRALLESVAQRHLLSSNVTDEKTLESAINQLRSDTVVETRMRGDFPERLLLTYRANDPQIARNVATDLVAVFGNMNEAQEKQLASESENLNAELDEVENRLSQINQQRTSRRLSGSGRPRIDLNAMRAERNASTATIESLTDKKFSLERGIAEQKKQIAEQQALVKTAPGDARSSSSFGVLLVRKAELEAQIKDYASQYTDKNPKIIQARAQLSEINNQLAELKSEAQGGAPLNSAEARELRQLQRELSRMETELEITQRAIERKKQTLASIPQVSAMAAATAPTSSTGSGEAEVAGAGNDYERLKNRFDSLLRRQERLQGARMTAAGLDPGLFQIVDMPSLPQFPVGPNRLKLLALALVLALGIALAVVVALEIPRLFSIRDDRDVEYFLGAPVVVLIPESVPPSEQQRTRRLFATRIIGMVVLSAFIIPALVYLLNNLQIFQKLAGQ